MDYELAKKLKDAGFPIEIPTLEELIEACGMGLSGLVRNDPMVSYNFPEKSGWVALSNRKNEIGERIEIWGETPDEAIANLWLKIQ